MTHLERMYRVITFIPPDHLAGLLESIRNITPVRYGQYDAVAWWVKHGIEQFRPLPGANPTAGKEGLLSQLPSARLEFAIPHDRELLQRVLKDGIIASHPWKEPVVFVQETEATRTQVDEQTKGQKLLSAGRTG